jgi:hypothetical protein
MSIVLPPEISDLPKRAKSRRKKQDPPLLARLKNLQFWQFLTGETPDKPQPVYGQPAGKIRLVTSRWDDRSLRSGRKNHHR